MSFWKRSESHTTSLPIVCYQRHLRHLPDQSNNNPLHNELRTRLLLRMYMETTVTNRRPLLSNLWSNRYEMWAIDLCLGPHTHTHTRRQSTLSTRQCSMINLLPQWFQLPQYLGTGLGRFLFLAIWMWEEQWMRRHHLVFLWDSPVHGAWSWPNDSCHSFVLERNRSCL